MIASKIITLLEEDLSDYKTNDNYLRSGEIETIEKCYNEIIKELKTGSLGAARDIVKNDMYASDFISRKVVTYFEQHLDFEFLTKKYQELFNNHGLSNYEIEYNLNDKAFEIGPFYMYVSTFDDSKNCYLWNTEYCEEIPALGWNPPDCSITTTSENLTEEESIIKIILNMIKGDLESTLLPCII